MATRRRFLLGLASAGLGLIPLSAEAAARPRVMAPLVPRTRVLALVPGSSETFVVPGTSRWVRVRAEIEVWGWTGEPLPRVQLDGPGRPSGMDCSWHVPERDGVRQVRSVDVGLIDCARGRSATLRSVGLTGSIVVLF